VVGRQGRRGREVRRLRMDKPGLDS
jgi:hypothetical protein